MFFAALRKSQPDRKAARQAVARQVGELERWIEAHAPPPKGPPVILFSATSHLHRPTLAALAILLTGWSLRLAGHRVVYFHCRRGLSQCVLGANRSGVVEPPPCDICVTYRSQLYPASHSVPLSMPAIGKDQLAEAVPYDWQSLSSFERHGIPFGRLALPSLRWIERVGTLTGTEYQTRMLREFILSGLNLVAEFDQMIARIPPLAVIGWNGVHYPEAVVGNAARRQNLRAISVETGFSTPSLFFTDGYAAQYDIAVPDDFELSPQEDHELDNLLSARRGGNIITAGRMIATAQRGLSDDLSARLSAFQFVVPIFTNVAWDTSQAFADQFFPNMFDWLDATLAQARNFPNTAFVVRAHPDEVRKGKPSREPVGAWLAGTQYANTPNVIFVGPDDRTSSYLLVDRAKFCVVYNSTIGIEAAIQGAYVLAGGWSRYRRSGIGRHINSRAEYLDVLCGLLNQPHTVTPDPIWRPRARQLMYYCYRYASLDLGELIEPLEYPEFGFKPFAPKRLVPEMSPVLETIVRGIVEGSPFILAKH